MAENLNLLVYNTGNIPVENFSFLLRVEGIYDVPCRAVHSFQKQNEYEYIQEGGLNDYVHLRRKPISQPFSFQVERYCAIDYLDPLPNGAELLLPIFLFVGAAYNNFVETRRTYVFTGCTVMGKEYGELSAEKSGLLVETTTIAYNDLFVMDIPFEV